MDAKHQPCLVKSAVMSLPTNGSDGRNFSELFFQYDDTRFYNINHLQDSHS
jgi:hypothetical protein